MEYTEKTGKKIIENKANPLFEKVTLTGGRFKKAFDNNINFLKKFDIDRMMYWFRVSSGSPAPSAPYAFSDGHFENSLYGQTVGMFLMSAGTALLWREDNDLRTTLNKIVDEISEFAPEDGCLIPVPENKRFTKEYPNYVRAWLVFGLLAAGYAGNEKAFELARKFGDWFNNCKELSIVKDMNLGFQGILANTELYYSPVGIDMDLEVAQKYYREEWYLEKLKNKDYDGLYRHPNHPHGTVLTAIEGYLDIYRATGEKFLFECVKNALEMVEEKWQHVGGGIVMCEGDGDPHYPGCNYLSMSHSYNELCCTTFWILLNQRMALLCPDNAHYYDQIEESVYNMLIGAQVDDIGYHYLGFLEGSKDSRFVDVATCCAATGSRLISMLPQMLYTHNEDTVYVNMFASSVAAIGNTEIEINTNMPYNGKVEIKLNKWNHKYLKIRIPYWCNDPIDICGKTAIPGSYIMLDNIESGNTIAFEMPFSLRTKLYSGKEVIPCKNRYAFQYGPLLLAALRSNLPTIKCDIANPVLKSIGKNKFVFEGNNQIEFMAYMDIKDEPLTVYPIVESDK